MKNRIMVITTIMFLFFNSVVFAQAMKIEGQHGDIYYKKISKTNKITFVTPPAFANCGDIVTDNRGGTTVYYETIQLGTQCWFRENLNVGTMVESTTSGSQQTNNSPTNTIEKYCYNNDDANCATYGGLYQWAEAVAYTNGATNTASPSPAFIGNIQGICPTGWHLPTEAEFQTLRTAVGGDGNALKAIGQGSGAGAGTNTSGFSGLLAGFRNGIDGLFYDLGSGAYFWSSTESGGFARYMHLYNDSSDVIFNTFNKDYGFSVRCLKD